MRYRVQPLSAQHINLLSRAASIEGDEGILVEGHAAISAQSLRRRGLIRLVNRRATAKVSGYLAFITEDGREELARLAQRATRRA